MKQSYPHHEDTSPSGPGGMASELPRELVKIILAKHSIVSLLVDVLNGRPLDELALIDTTETLDELLGGKWRVWLDRFSILLRELASCKNFEEMKRREHYILRWASDLSEIDGRMTTEAVMRTSWSPSEAGLLREQMRKLSLELVGFRQQLIDTSKPEANQIKFKTRELKPKLSPPTSIATKEESDRIDVEFTLAEPLVGEKPKTLNADWRMLEHFLWRKKPVHWLEGYLIFPNWQKKKDPIANGRNQFRLRKDSCTRVLGRKFGIELEFRGNKPQKADTWELVKHNLSTNMPKAEDHYCKAQEAFGNHDFHKTKTDLLEALKAYPNQTDSQLLLVEYCEEQGFENVSDDEIDSLLLNSWASLKQRSDGLKKICDFYGETKNEELRIAISVIQHDPVYFRLKVHKEILGKWLAKGTFTEDDKIILELSNVLNAIVAAETKAEQEEKKEAFCKIPWVEEIITSHPVWAERVAVLLYPEIEDGLQSTRLQAMANRVTTITAKDDFVKYFKNILRSIGKAMEAKQELPESDDFSKTISQIKKLKRVEEDLCQKLSKSRITEEELIEEAHAKLHWGKEHIKHLVEIRKKPLSLFEDPASPDAPDNDVDALDDDLDM